MKAESKVTLLKLLSSSLLVATAFVTTGCIAQAGTGTDDPGTAEQALTAGTGAKAAAQPVAEQNQQGPAAEESPTHLAKQFTTSTVVGPTRVDEINLGSDPGAPVESSGNEPDPVPWNPSRTLSVQR